MNARLASRAGRLRRRNSVRRLGEGSSGPEFHQDPETGSDMAIPLKPEMAKVPAKIGRAAKSAHSARSTNPAPVPHGTMVAFARETYNLRRRRARFLPTDLFGEPTWDILLDLYVATCENRSVPTTSACIGAHVPPTTALRWLRILEARGLVEREEDGSDGRRTFVRLSEQGLTAMEDWLRTALASLDQIVGTLFQNGADRHIPMAEAAE